MFTSLINDTDQATRLLNKHRSCWAMITNRFADMADSWNRTGLMYLKVPATYDETQALIKLGTQPYGIVVEVQLTQAMHEGQVVGRLLVRKLDELSAKPAGIGSFLVDRQGVFLNEDGEPLFDEDIGHAEGYLVLCNVLLAALAVDQHKPQG